MSALVKQEILALLEAHTDQVFAAKNLAAEIVENPTKPLFQVTFGEDRHLGFLMRNYPNRIEACLIERVTHHAWKKYFYAVGAFDALGEKYYKAIHPYQFSDLTDNNYYDDHKKIMEFNIENILAFEAAHMVSNEAEILEKVKTFLRICGSSKSPTQYKSRLLITEVARYNHCVVSERADRIGSLVRAVAYLQGHDEPKLLGKTKDILIKQLVVGQELELYEGVTLTLKDNLNADLALSKEVVALLNSKLPIAA